MRGRSGCTWAHAPRARARAARSATAVPQPCTLQRRRGEHAHVPLQHDAAAWRHSGNRGRSWETCTCARPPCRAPMPCARAAAPSAAPTNEVCSGDRRCVCAVAESTWGGRTQVEKNKDDCSCRRHSCHVRGQLRLLQRTNIDSAPTAACDCRAARQAHRGVHECEKAQLGSVCVLLTLPECM